MSQPLDFLIVGTSPTAAFLALDLARTQGAKTGLLGRIRSPFMIQREIPVAAGAITRPETWALLNNSTQDFVRIFSALGLSGLQKNDVVVASLDPEAQYALQHSRQMALMYGVSTEKLPDSSSNWYGTLTRQATQLSPLSLLDDLPEALANAGVQLFDPQTSELKLGTSGTGRLLLPADEVQAKKILLVDGDAIQSVIPQKDCAALFETRMVSAMLFSEHAQWRWPILIDPAFGGQATTTAFGSPWARHIGDEAALVDWVGAALAPDCHGEVVARASWTELASKDGAAIVGQLRKSGPCIVHLPQPYGLFLAPALSRVLAGTANEQDRAYFEARAPRSFKLRTNVAEYTPLASLGGAQA